MGPEDGTKDIGALQKAEKGYEQEEKLLKEKLQGRVAKEREK